MQLVCCHGCMTYLSFPPQSTPECSRSLPKNYTASSVMPSSAKKWEDVSGVLFFGSFPVVCYTGDAIKHCVLAVTRDSRSLGKKGVKTSSLFCVVFHSNGWQECGKAQWTDSARVSLNVQFQFGSGHSLSHHPHLWTEKTPTFTAVYRKECLNVMAIFVSFSCFNPWKTQTGSKVL